MTAQNLHSIFKNLSQSSAEAVQRGSHLSALDSYMHVERPIEKRLLEKMKSIDEAGGGIVLLVGSAGDGKSHLISRLRDLFSWDAGCYYNDATASSSPKRTAIETLKEALSDFKDDNLSTTTKKLVLAINLGKLNAFIDEEEVKSEYSAIVKACEPIFDDDDTTPPIESNRIKVILFEDEQAFEFYPDKDEKYPVSSSFLSAILEKIVNKSIENPFYAAYKKDLEEGASPTAPIILNYELLSLKETRNSIVNYIIEAIIRYKLIITPREFLDFVYSIMVSPFLNSYKEKESFYEALLPSLLFCGKENMIQEAISRLDPLKHSSTEHDRDLSLLFTSYSIPGKFMSSDILSMIPAPLINRTNEFYANNGRDIERTTKFLFRLKHLLDYHSESDVYREYLKVLCGIFNGNKSKMQDVYSLVSRAIPRHFGSYYSKANMIPLNLQGGRYRMFSSLSLKPEIINSTFSKEQPNKFYLRFDLSWSFSGDKVPLRMDFQLYSYLWELNAGKLALSYENEKDLAFSRFVRKLVEKCDCSEEITIVRSDGKELKLSESSFGNSIELS